MSSSSSSFNTSSLIAAAAGKRSHSATDDESSSSLPPTKVMHTATSLDNMVAMINAALDRATIDELKVVPHWVLARALHGHLHFKCDGETMYMAAEDGFVWSESTAPLYAAINGILISALRRAKDQVVGSDADHEDLDEDELELMADKHSALLDCTVKSIRTKQTFVNSIVTACTKHSAAQEAGFAQTLDKNTRLLACTDGVIDLTSGSVEFRAGTLDDRISRTCGLALGSLASMTADELRYDERLAPLLGLFAKSFPDQSSLTVYMQFLACLVRCEGGNNRYLHVLHGSGRNSKTATANVGMAMLGGYAETADSSLLTKAPPTSEKPRADLWKLRGARLITTSEVSGKDTLLASSIKRLLGGEPISVRPPHSKVATDITFRAHLLLTTNALPQLNTTPEDHPAMVARTRLLQFSVRFFQSKDDAQYDASNPCHVIGVSEHELNETITTAAPLLLLYLLKQYEPCDVVDPLWRVPSMVESTTRYVVKQARDTVFLWHKKAIKEGRLVRRSDYSPKAIADIPSASVKAMRKHYRGALGDLNIRAGLRRGALPPSTESFVMQVSALTNCVTNDGVQQHSKQVWPALIWTPSLTEVQLETLEFARILTTHNTN